MHRCQQRAVRQTSDRPLLVIHDDQVPLGMEHRVERDRERLVEGDGAARRDVRGRLVERVHDRRQREAVELFPDARLVVLPGTGHLAHYETPGLVADAIRSFLAELPAASPPTGGAAR